MNKKDFLEKIKLNSFYIPYSDSKSFIEFSEETKALITIQGKGLLKQHERDEKIKKILEE